MLHHLGAERVAVDRHAIEAVEAFLVMLEQVYRAVYFHPAVRGATVLLTSILKRAVYLHRQSDKSIFSQGSNKHPFQNLVDQGQNIDLRQYMRLGDFHMWSLIEDWQLNKDKILSDLSRRLMRRNLFKTVDIDSLKSTKDVLRLHNFLHDAVAKHLSIDAKSTDYYVDLDEQARTGYKRYDMLSEAGDESVWLIGGGRDEGALEEEEDNPIVAAIKGTKHFDRLVFPSELQEIVRNEISRVPQKS